MTVPSQSPQPASPASEFYGAVEQVVRRIPAGRVINYGRVALLAGYPGYARAVGRALHVLGERDSHFPWWRIINRAGRISTRCPIHSMDEQRARLEAEGVEFDEDDCVDWERFGWFGD